MTPDFTAFGFWLVVCYLSGSIPWALLVGTLLVHKDVRNVGDGNPGTANVWKSGGWAPGMLSFILEVGKSLIPVYLAFLYIGNSSGIVSQMGLALIALAPILGHGWSPFLKFKGGKTLAAGWGSWMAITDGMAFPIGCVFLGLMHVVQRNHAITVTASLIAIFAVFMTLGMELHIVILGLVNMMIIVYKHREKYFEGIELRQWIIRIVEKNE